MRNWLTLSDEEKKQLEIIATSGLAAKNLQIRANVLLLASQGLPDYEIASQLGIGTATAMRWIARFRDRPAGSDMLSVLKTKDGRGRASKFDESGREWVRGLASEKRSGMTLEAFTEYVQSHAMEAGHPAFASICRSALWYILHEND